ncbi:hypothetical protein A6R68_21913 [Neotoma lepida]|uniref:Uncharacterized protein n=1 Tax=Neotoma lepida TaxID=56216 RepID=A0A1A6HNR1_NEOLE|nr:hypothetical protein A6R68_21913 [Neotoma lepida]
MPQHFPLHQSWGTEGSNDTPAQPPEVRHQSLKKQNAFTRAQRNRMKLQISTLLRMRGSQTECDSRSSCLPCWNRNMRMAFITQITSAKVKGNENTKGKLTIRG